jgi:excisionase family DNA binding protein
MSNLQIEQRLFSIESEISKLSLEIKTILTAEQAAEFLGLKPSYLYKLTSDKKIKFFKPQGKLIYFRKEDLEAFLLRNPSESSDIFESEVFNHWKK